MGLFDVHAHLTDARLAACEADVLKRAHESGITTIVSNGLNPSDNEAVRALAARSDIVFPAFGLYPVDAVLPEMRALGIEYGRPDASACEADEALQWLRDHAEDAIAVGEIGLDRYWVPEELWERQEQVFREALRIAKERDKPVIVHSRKAERRMLEVLTEEGIDRVNWHCFGGKVKLGQRIAGVGHWLSVPANVRRSQSMQRLLETVEKDRLLLETDCPYLAPERGELNEPANVVGTAAFAAELWGWSTEDVTERLERNFEALFGFAP